MTSHYIATLMQPLQCDSRPSATFHRRLQPLYTEKHKVSCSGILPNSTSPMQHSCGHCNAFCSITWQTRVYLRIWQQNITTIMRPFHCDLQPQIPKHPKTARAHTNASKAARSHSYGPAKKRQNERSRNRRGHKLPFIAGCQPLDTEKHKVWYSDTSPTRHSCSHYNAIHAAFTMRFAPTRVTMHHFPQSPPFVIILRHHPSSSLPSVTSSPFVITTLRHHPSYFHVRWLFVM